MAKLIKANSSVTPCPINIYAEKKSKINLAIESEILTCLTLEVPKKTACSIRICVNDNAVIENNIILFDEILNLKILFTTIKTIMDAREIIKKNTYKVLTNANSIFFLDEPKYFAAEFLRPRSAKTEKSNAEVKNNP